MLFNALYYAVILKICMMCPWWKDEKREDRSKREDVIGDSRREKKMRGGAFIMEVIYICLESPQPWCLQDTDSR